MPTTSAALSISPTLGEVALYLSDRLQKKILFKRYMPVVFKECSKALKHRQDAEDVTQQVFLKVFKYLAGHNFDPDAPFEPFLRVTIRNCIIDFTRSRRSNVLTSAQECQEDSSISTTVEVAPHFRPSISLEQRDANRILVSVERSLSPAQRRVFALQVSDEHERNSAKLARFLNMSPSTYRRHQQDLREKARKILQCLRSRKKK